MYFIFSVRFFSYTRWAEEYCDTREKIVYIIRYDDDSPYCKRAPDRARRRLNGWNVIFQAECEYDRVEVYSKIGSDKLRKHGVYCGQEAPSMITSEANALRVEFESDSSVHKSGFAAVFFTGNDNNDNDGMGPENNMF